MEYAIQSLLQYDS